MSKLEKNDLTSMNGAKDWLRAPVNKFWGEIASMDHAVQIYEDDDILINSIAGFVGDGINCGDTTIVVATPYHIAKLEEKLEEHGINVDALISQNRYVPVDAEEALQTFMIDDWPDAPLFFLTVSELLTPLKAEGRPIRAFGEMVALLWERGHKGATIQLEYLWNQYFETEAFPMFCAYPRAAFTEGLQNSLSGICCAHSKIISGTESHLSEVVYRNIDPKRPDSNNTFLS
jgi:hypothetical protein